MAVTVAGSGTTAQTVAGGESTYYTTTGEGVFQASLDTNLMAAGDVIEVRVKQANLAAGTVRVVAYAMFTGAQPTEDLMKVTIPIVVDPTATATIFTISQPFGTARALPYVVRKL